MFGETLCQMSTILTNTRSECLPVVPKRTNPFEPLQRLEQPQVAGSAWSLSSLRHYQVPFPLLYTPKVAHWLGLVLAAYAGTPIALRKHFSS